MQIKISLSVVEIIEPIPISFNIVKYFHTFQYQEFIVAKIVHYYCKNLSLCHGYLINKHVPPCEKEILIAAVRAVNNAMVK